MLIIWQCWHFETSVLIVTALNSTQRPESLESILTPAGHQHSSWQSGKASAPLCCICRLEGHYLRGWWSQTESITGKKNVFFIPCLHSSPSTAGMGKERQCRRERLLYKVMACYISPRGERRRRMSHPACCCTPAFSFPSLSLFASLWSFYSSWTFPSLHCFPHHCCLLTGRGRAEDPETNQQLCSNLVMNSIQ